MQRSIFAFVLLGTILLVNGNEVSDKVLQWLRADNGQVLHMLPASAMDRQAVSLGRLFKRADMIRLLKRTMEDHDNFEDSDLSLEEEDYPVVGKRDKMVRLLRSGRQLVRLLRSDQDNFKEDKKATKMVRLLRK